MRTIALLCPLLLALSSCASNHPTQTSVPQPQTFPTAQASPPSPEPYIRSSPVGVGETAPDFTLENQNGQRVTLSTARGRAPVVLVFYRGSW